MKTLIAILLSLNLLVLVVLVLADFGAQKNAAASSTAAPTQLAPAYASDCSAWATRGYACELIEFEPLEVE